MADRRRLDLLTVHSSAEKPVRSWTYDGMLLLESDTQKVFQLKGGAWVELIGSDGTISAEESDPIFVASPANNVTNTKIGNWDLSFGWGDHGAAGYGKLADIQTWTGATNIFDGSVGVGASPSFDVHIQRSAAIAALVLDCGLDTSSAAIRLDNDLGDFAFLQSHGSASALSRWGVSLARWAEFRAINGDGFAIGTSSASPVRIGTNSTTAMLIDGAQSVQFGNPTGGQQGPGTTNAEGVYDDGTLLTDYVADAWIDGDIDLAKWDATVPDRVIPAVPDSEDEEPETETITRTVEEWSESRQAFVRRRRSVQAPIHDSRPVQDEAGNRVGTRRVPRTRKVTTPGTPERVITRTHEPARRFDPAELDVSAYIAKFRDRRKLPAIDRAEQAATARGNAKPSLGETSQALTETVEVMVAHIAALKAENDALNARITALEAGQEPTTTETANTPSNRRNP